MEYEVYAQILLELAFGYLIVSAVAKSFHWPAIDKCDHFTVTTVKSVVMIAGIGAMVATIAEGVALGGFLGMVVGFASQ